MNWNDKVKDWFSTDGVAGKWNDMYASDTDALDEYFFRQRRAFTLDYVTTHCTTEDRILDLGCGAGPVISALREHGYDCCGMDYSLDMLRHAGQRVAALTSAPTLLVRADAHRTPFRDGHFDFVVCLGVISYLQDYSVLLSEIRRLLRPGGQSIITFRNKYNPVLSDPVASLGYLGRKLLGRDPGADDQTLGRFLSPAHVEARLAAAGLEIIDFQGIGYGPFRIHGRRLVSDRRGKRLSDAISRRVERLGLRSVNKWWTDVSIYIVRRD